MWFKVVGMLQQNWAIPDDVGGVLFVNDRGRVFDEMRFTSADAACAGLMHNGFAPFADVEDAQRFVRAPEPPFERDPLAWRPIYSSGEYWTQS